MADDPSKIRVADFSGPKPFKTTKGAFHPYTYIPFLGWLPPTELNLLILVVGIVAAVALPRPGLARKALGALIALGAIAAAVGAILGAVYAGFWLKRAWFRRWGRARITRRLAAGPPLERVAAAHDLWEWGPEAAPSVPELSAAVLGDDESLREAAISVLAQIGPGASPATPALIAALKDARCGYEAARTLGRIGPGAATAVPALVAALRAPGQLLRADAAEALGLIGADAAAVVPALAAALSDPYDIARWHAAEALGCFGTAAASAVPPLIAGLDDRETFWSAARALGRVGAGSTEAVAALEAMRDGADERRREEAVAALERLKKGG